MLLRTKPLFKNGALVSKCTILLSDTKFKYIVPRALTTYEDAFIEPAILHSKHLLCQVTGGRLHEDTLGARYTWCSCDSSTSISFGAHCVGI